MSGIRKRISIHRALVLDTLHFARSVPSFSVEKIFSLGQLAQRRRNSQRRISWSVLFLKAHALVMRDLPVLRQVFCQWPWPHLYESCDIVGALAIARNCQGEERLCWGRFPQPDATPLAELQSALDRYQTLPVEDVFRRQLRLSCMPTWLRRLAWRIGLYVDVPRRAKRFGNFSISSLAGQGAINRTHPSIHTSSLTYGPIDPIGRCLVTLLCDHRVLDGLAAARALNRLEELLNTQIAEELGELADQRDAA
jgi:hypothetical protein